MPESFTLPDLDDLLDRADALDAVGSGASPLDPAALRLTRTKPQTLRWHLRSPTTIVIAAVAGALTVAMSLLPLAFSPGHTPIPGAVTSPTILPSPANCPTASSAAPAPVTPGSVITVKVTRYVTVAPTTAEKGATGTEPADLAPGGTARKPPPPGS